MALVDPTVGVAEIARDERKTLPKARCLSPQERRYRALLLAKMTSVSVCSLKTPVGFKPRNARDNSASKASAASPNNDLVEFDFE